ncbi:hypothetical protein CK203_005406 [Vitis vinifera]|uniref:Uncharacterized protein n=1 Tax=Vitis vinifera TaxID=29760 RepID=A0A438KEV1_VITVI|nr:hypothetical protein CK203_005406 [Vitis vinifera]
MGTKILSHGKETRSCEDFDFSPAHGHPALIGRHRPFPVTHQAAERHTAFFLVAGDELKNRSQGVPCKHGASKPAAV